MAMRYTQEQKAAAVKSIEETGVAKTAKVMSIAVQTLQMKNDQLEAENKALRAALARYKAMLVAAIEEGL